MPRTRLRRILLADNDRDFLVALSARERLRLRHCHRFKPCESFGASFPGCF
jgi:hypothetical protein